MIGRKMLESQLHQIGIFGADETIGSHPDFDASFKICKHVFLAFHNIIIAILSPCYGIDDDKTSRCWLNTMFILFCHPFQCGLIMVMK